MVSLKKPNFRDEAAFHLYLKVSRHNVRIWGTENPHAAVEHIRNSPKLYVFCAVSKEKVCGPFFFAESTVTGTSYLDMMQECLMPQPDDDSDDFIYQQDGAPPHYHHLVLNQYLPQRWIVANDQALLRWPSRSPDLTPCHFFTGVR
jgi:hypothetical protein